ncbi:hypothetical protein C8Q76DRAFT_790741 [Earliella scabrosa]|nr:hypothetical protein C8Q76DRAFT_790741 [Earliella scabrosa]
MLSSTRIPFLLHLHPVAYNFVYRPPRTAQLCGLEQIVDSSAGAASDWRVGLLKKDRLDLGQLVENTKLYNIFRPILIHHSHWFHTLFSVPAADVTEGTMDYNPIILEGIPADEFDLLSDFMFGLNFVDTEKNLKKVIRIAIFFEIPKVRDHAYARLRSIPTASIALQLHLALHYDIDEWKDPISHSSPVNATSVPAPKRKGKEREASRHTYATPTPVPAGFEEPTEGVTMNNFGGFPDEDPADERAAFDDDPEAELDTWRARSDNDIRTLSRARVQPGPSSSSKKGCFPQMPCQAPGTHALANAFIKLTRRSLSIQDLRPRHDSSAEVYTCAHTPRSPTFRLPSPTPSTRVCVRSPIISPVLGLPHSRARLLSTYSSAEVYTCAHSSPDEHDQDPQHSRPSAPPRLVR